MAAHRVPCGCCGKPDELTQHQEGNIFWADFGHKLLSKGKVQHMQVLSQDDLVEANLHPRTAVSGGLNWPGCT